MWIQIAVWLDLALAGVEAAFHPKCLPITGSGFGQVGMLLVVGTCISEAMRIVREARKQVNEARHSGADSGAGDSGPTSRYIGPERRVSTDKRPWVGGRRASDRIALAG